MDKRSVPLSTIAKRGLSKRCPRCGQGHLYEGFYSVHERCPECSYRYEAGSGDTWAFMYITTAALTGFIVIAMFLLHPSNTWLGLFLVILAAVTVIAGTLPIRKSIAIALEYIISTQFDHQHANEQVEQKQENPPQGEGK